MPALDDYLTVVPQGNQGNVWSCFAAALRDARKATGRNEDTGQVESPQAQGNWLGAVGYLCLFDQLGSTVRLAVTTLAVTAKIQTLPAQGAERAFRSTLHQFSGITERDSATLWALRNALAHNYSLIHKPTNPNRTELLHRFALVAGGNALVTYPAQPWDGGFPGQGGQTVVSVTQLGFLGEAVAAQILQDHGNGAVVTDLSDNELWARYFLALGHLGLV